jgi:hypothetical protein
MGVLADFNIEIFSATKHQKIIFRFSAKKKKSFSVLTYPSGVSIYLQKSKK